MTRDELREAGRMLRWINRTRKPYQQARVQEFKPSPWPITHSIQVAAARCIATAAVERLLAETRSMA